MILYLFSYKELGIYWKEWCYSENITCNIGQQLKCLRLWVASNFLSVSLIESYTAYYYQICLLCICQAEATFRVCL